MKKKIRSWFKCNNSGPSTDKYLNKGPKTKEAESKIGNKYDHIDLDLLLLEEFGMKINKEVLPYIDHVIQIDGQNRHLEVYNHCIFYKVNDLPDSTPIPNDIFILADIVREKYNMKPHYNIFDNAKIDGGI